MSKFEIKVCLVPFIHTSTGDEKRDIEVDGETVVEMKVGLVKNDLGYSVLYRNLEQGETSLKIVNDILIDQYFEVDRVAGDFYLMLCDCIDGPNRYAGQRQQDACLVYRLDISKKEKDCPDFTWIDGHELGELASSKKLLGDTQQIIEASLSYGHGKNEPIPTT